MTPSIPDLFTPHHTRLLRGLHPGRGAERLSERFFGIGPDAKKRIRSRVLRDVA